MIDRKAAINLIQWVGVELEWPISWIDAESMLDEWQQVQAPPEKPQEPAEGTF